MVAALIRIPEYLAARPLAHSDRARFFLDGLSDRLHDLYYRLPRRGLDVRFLDQSAVELTPTDRSGLLDNETSLPAVWHCASLERRRLHPGHLSDLSVDMGNPSAREIFSSPHYDAPAAYFARFRHATVMPGYGVVMPSPGNFWCDSLVTASWRSPIYRGVPGLFKTPDGYRFQSDCARPGRIIDHCVLMLAHWVYQNYGHWHMDCLPGLLPFLEEVRRGEIRLLMPPVSDFHRQSLDRLGVLHALDEVEEDVIDCADLIYPSYLSGYYTQSPSSVAAEVFRALKQARPVLDSIEAPPLIYLSRDDRTKGRIFGNEEEIKHLLQHYGFVSVNPVRLSLDETISTFSRARIIVGPYGAGLANIGYAPAGCTIVTIVSEFSIRSWIYRLTAVLKQRFVYIIAAAPPERRRIHNYRTLGGIHLNYEYIVDPSAVVRAVEGVLRDIGQA